MTTTARKPALIAALATAAAPLSVRAVDGEASEQ